MGGEHEKHFNFHETVPICLSPDFPSGRGNGNRKLAHSFSRRDVPWIKGTASDFHFGLILSSGGQVRARGGEELSGC